MIFPFAVVKHFIHIKLTIFCIISKLVPPLVHLSIRPQDGGGSFNPSSGPDIVLIVLVVAWVVRGRADVVPVQSPELGGCGASGDKGSEDNLEDIVCLIIKGKIACILKRSPKLSDLSVVTKWMAKRFHVKMSVTAIKPLPLSAELATSSNFT